MKIKGNTTWKPAVAKRPMLTNGPRFQIGQGPLIPAEIGLGAALLRWVLPWLAISGGIALTSSVASKSLPELPINKSNIALASALGGGGGAAYFVAQGLPDSAKPWAYAAAVAGIASGLYFLFQEPPAPYEPGYTQTVTGGVVNPETPPQNCVVPSFAPLPMPVGPTQSGIRVIFDPNQTLTGSTTRSKYTEQEYVVTLQNLNNAPRCFFIGLNIKDDEGNPSYEDRTDFPNGVSPTTPSPYQRQYVFLAARGNTAKVSTPDGKITTVHDAESFKLKAPAYVAPSSWAGFGNLIPGIYHDATVAVEMFRNASDPKPFQVSDPISIRFATIG